jgi:hypothetical protein
VAAASKNGRRTAEKTGRNIAPTILLNTLQNKRALVAVNIGQKWEVFIEIGRVGTASRHSCIFYQGQGHGQGRF